MKIYVACLALLAAAGYSEACAGCALSRRESRYSYIEGGGATLFCIFKCRLTKNGIWCRFLRLGSDEEIGCIPRSGPETDVDGGGGTGDCANKYDFSLMIDESASVGQANFDEQKQFLADFSKEYTVGDDETRFAYTRFSTAAATVFPFTATQTTDAVSAGILGITYTAGQTHITAALENSNLLFTGTKRPDIPQVAVLVTDGEHNQGDPPPTVPAQTLRDQGIFIFVVGIGGGVVQADLEAIAGDPARVFTAEFGQLNSVVESITQSICSAVTAASPPSSGGGGGGGGCGSGSGSGSKSKSGCKSGSKSGSKSSSSSSDSD